MRVCFFGTYNREHSANRIYARAIRAAGHELIEIHEPLWEQTRDKGRAYFGPLGLVTNGLRWLGAAVRLARRWRTSGGAPVVLVGFNGQLDVLLLKLLTRRDGPHVVFAPLVSLTETLIDDRRRYPRDSWMARMLGALDRAAASAADVLVADTQAHRQYFIDRLGVDASRVAVLHLGVDNEVFGRSPDASGLVAEPAAAKPLEDGRLEVLYFGQYLPLHGLEVIVDAVGLLAPDKDLKFVFIGTGEDRAGLEAHARATKAKVEFIDWVDYEALGRRVAAADIVLGTFGSSEKADMVIANKVYEAAAEGAAIVTADNMAIREVFEPGTDLLVTECTGVALARKIRRLANDPQLREDLGRAAREKMRQRFGDEAQARAWTSVLGMSALDAETLSEQFRLAVTILNFNDSEATLRCLESLEESSFKPFTTIVWDNASEPAELARLRDGLAQRGDVRLVAHDENLGFAGAHNQVMAAAFADGADAVLLLNDDTIVTPNCLESLAALALAKPDSGPMGPLVSRDWPGSRPLSRGERYWASTAWLPRTLLRYRRPRQTSYAVEGVMGSAFLINRGTYEALGGFDDGLFAYYEEVDYCLRARAAGRSPRIEPFAEIAHRGHRGFGSGFSEIAGYLKSRNLLLLGRRWATGPKALLFYPGYAVMMLMSLLGYILRGRVSTVASMLAGIGAGVRGEVGPPPDRILKRGRS